MMKAISESDWPSIVVMDKNIPATGFAIMFILLYFRKMGGHAVIALFGTLCQLQRMKTVCATGGQRLTHFALAHLSLLCVPKMFWSMNHLIHSVYGAEVRDMLDAKLKNTSHAMMCSSHYL